jgi:hypothetical protein
MKIDPEIPSSVRKLAVVLSQPKAMRRGSVSERTMKCGKASCPCQGDPKARHGPYYSLTRPVAGKTQSRYLSSEQAELARRQLEEGHKFREQVEQYREACEQWADAQLECPRQPSPRRPKKGAPNGPPKRNRPGNRNPLRAAVDRRLGFRSGRDGGATPGFALGRACVGTTAET